MATVADPHGLDRGRGPHRRGRDRRRCPGRERTGSAVLSRRRDDVNVEPAGLRLPGAAAT